MSALPRRILKETQRLMQEPVPGISAQPDEGNARYLTFKKNVLFKLIFKFCYQLKLDNNMVFIKFLC